MPAAAALRAAYSTGRLRRPTKHAPELGGKISTLITRGVTPRGRRFAQVLYYSAQRTLITRKSAAAKGNTVQSTIA